MDYLKYGALFIFSLFFILRLIFFIADMVGPGASEIGYVICAIALLNATLVTGFAIIIKNKPRH